MLAAGNPCRGVTRDFATVWAVGYLIFCLWGFWLRAGVVSVAFCARRGPFCVSRSLWGVLCASCVCFAALRRGSCCLGSGAVFD